MLYKYVGIGLLALFAIIAIPVTTNAETDDPKMYGMTTLALKDSTGNVLFETILHNEVLDQGTTHMLRNTFSSTGPSFGDVRKAICLTNEVGFAVNDGETFTSFNTGSTINTASFDRCIRLNFVAGANSITSGVVSFLAGTHFAAGDTMTGIGICGAGSSSGIGTSIDCQTSSIGTAAVLLGVININDVTPGTGDQIDVTYTLNLD